MNLTPKQRREVKRFEDAAVLNALHGCVEDLRDRNEVLQALVRKMLPYVRESNYRHGGMDAMSASLIERAVQVLEEKSGS